MNIFFLSKDTRECAEYHCDRHVVKMILEYNQLLSTAHRLIDGHLVDGLSKSGRKRKVWVLDEPRDSVLYSATHMNHPSAVWCRQSVDTYKWLHTMLGELLKEYTRRYNKVHACSRLFEPLSDVPKNLKAAGWIDPPPAMPDHCKVPGNSIQSYRNYYIKEKSRFATWKTQTPEWYTKGIENANVSI